MITIILVDDEIETRRIIARYLNATQSYRVIGEAGNGIEALALLESRQPDVVITDICMPNMDGLELVKQIRHLEYAIKVIIMSGYSDFDYAQQAIRYNVEEYLLKPFLPSSLEEILASIAKRQKVSRYSKEGSEDGRNNFLNSMVKGDLDTVAILQGIKDLQLPLGGNAFILGFLRFFSKTAGEIPFDRKVLRSYAREVLPSCLKSGLQGVCFLQSRERMSILFSFQGCQEESFRREVTQAIRLLSSYMEAKYQTSVWCGFSPIYNALTQSSEANAKAEIVWKQYCSLKDPCNFYEERVVSQDGIDSLLQEIISIENNCALALSLGDGSSILFLDSLFPSLEELTLLDYHAMQVNLLSFVIRISNLVNTEGINTKTLEDFNTYLNDAKAIGSLFETKHLLKKAIATALAVRHDSKRPVSECIVSSIQAKVQENLGNEKFTVDDALAGLNYSKNYLRHIFSQTKGESIKEYLIRERMNLAKQLLRDSSIPIKEIAERTGYRNQHYFSFGFKEALGISPSQWRSDNTDR